MSLKEKCKEANQLPWNHILGLLGTYNTKNKTLCPFHDDSTPSYHLYDTHGYCFVCSKKSSKIDFIMTSFGIDLKAAVELILGNAINYKPTTKPQKKLQLKSTKMNKEKLEKAKKIYSTAKPIHEVPDALDAWVSSGIDPITALVFNIKVGYIGGCMRILLPDFDENDELTDLTGRRYDYSKDCKYWNLVTPKTTYFKGIDDTYPLESIVITEGQKDAIASYEIGIPAVALGGSDTKGLINIKCKKWFIYPDDDLPGKQIEEKIAEVALSKNQANPIRISLGLAGKDLSEHLANLKCKPLREFIHGDTVAELLQLSWNERLYEFSKLTNTFFRERINNELRSA